jgi:hypothetical protein
MMKRGNCIAWALRQWFMEGGYIRIAQSPDFPLLPRVSWSPNNETFYRYHPVSVHGKPSGFTRWFPVHCLWFRGKVVRDIR